MINDVIHNLPTPFPVDEPNRIRVFDTVSNDKVVLKIGDNDKKWYDMGFRLNNVWSDQPKIDLRDGYKYLKPDIKIKSLEVDNLILSDSTNEILPSEVFLNNIKVGLGISRTNADSQWNPFYNAFHRNFCCANETICL